MTKRIKTVFSNSQVFHVFASRSQESGRNANGSIYFNGDTIYSYGSHFPLGKFHGKSVFINSASYSTTTAKHKFQLRQAISHLDEFIVPNVLDPKAEENVLYLGNRIADLAENIYKKKRCTKFDWDDFINSIEVFDVYCQRFEIDDSSDIDDEFMEEIEEIFETKLKQQQIYNAKKDAERAEWQRLLEKAEAKALEDAKRDLEFWKDWQLPTRVNFWQLPVALRADENIIQTSHGAEVPLEHAQRLYKMYKSKQNLISERIGHFKVDAFNPETITIGCHEIPMSEVERVLG